MLLIDNNLARSLPESSIQQTTAAFRSTYSVSCIYLRDAAALERAPIPPESRTMCHRREMKAEYSTRRCVVGEGTGRKISYMSPGCFAGFPIAGRLSSLPGNNLFPGEKAGRYRERGGSLRWTLENLEGYLHNKDLLIAGFYKLPRKMEVGRTESAWSNVQYIKDEDSGTVGCCGKQDSFVRGRVWFFQAQNCPRSRPAKLGPTVFDSPRQWTASVTLGLSPRVWKKQIRCIQRPMETTTFGTGLTRS